MFRNFISIICNSLAKAFGKDVGYTVGLLFLPTIFYMILGFGKAEYVGKESVSTTSTYQGDGSCQYF